MLRIGKALVAALFVSVLLISSAGLAMAQTVAGSLAGLVTDRSGAVIPQAKVTMTNKESGDTRRTETNGEGYFTISGVVPGLYSVTIEHPGMTTYKQENITFTAGDRRTLTDVALGVATTGTEIQVVSAQDIITPVDSGEKSSVINTQQLQNISVVGRSAAEFIKILPGFATLGNGVENRPGYSGETIGINGGGEGGRQSAIGSYSANGTRPEALDIVADGAHVSDPGCNCASPVNPNPDMISELKVQQSNFSAENSKGPVVINSITKSGGRSFHGTGYLYARHYAMNSNDAQFNATGQPKPENRYFFPGFNIGGPVLIPGTGFNKNRDKLFFFSGFEYYQQRLDTGLLKSQVPTAAMLNGDFTDTRTLNAFGKASSNANAGITALYPNGIIPKSELDPGMLALLKLLPAPNADPAGTGNGYNYIQAISLDQNSWQWATRFDYSIDDYTKLFVRYNKQKELQNFPVQLWWRSSGAVPLPTPINGKNDSDSISVSLTKVFSPSLTNEFVFGYSFIDFPNSYEDPSKLSKTSVGYPYKGIFGEDPKVPAFQSWSGPTPSLWTTGGFDPTLFATKHLYTVNDGVTKVLSTHSIKFGAYYGYIRNNQPGNGNSNANLIFTPWGANTTGNVLADMVTGRVTQYQESNLNVARDIRWRELAFYAQDSWKATPRLTLEYGLRVQHQEPWTPRNGIGLSVFDPKLYNANADPTTYPGVTWNKVNANIGLSGWGSRLFYYSPRLGFAYDVFGKGNTVVRGGWGKFTYHDAQAAADSVDFPAGYRTATICCGSLLRDVVNTPKSQAVGSVSLVDPNDDRQPTTYSYSFTISQRLPKRMVYEVAYVGNKSSNLLTNNGFGNINAVPAGALLSDPTANPNSARPYKLYGDLSVNSHQLYSNYNGLQTTLAKQTGQVNFTVAYTFSKALGINTAVDQTRIDNNYGILSFDRTHILSTSYVWFVPNSTSQNRLVRGAINGWEVSGITQLQSGPPLQWNSSTNFGLSTNATATTGTPSIQAQPVLTCDPRSNLSANQFINPSCFALPTPGRNGSIELPYLKGPAYFNSDLSLFKNFQMGESRKLQFRASAYNFLNHPLRSFVGGDPNLNINSIFDANGKGSSTGNRFGYADSYVGRRLIQLAVKFYF